MQNTDYYYNSASNILNIMESELNGYFDNQEKVITAEIEYDNALAKISADLSAAGTAKTAIKDFARAHPTVIEKKEIKLKAELDSARAIEKYKFLDKKYLLEKEAIKTGNTFNNVASAAR